MLLGHSLLCRCGGLDRCWRPNCRTDNPYQDLCKGDNFVPAQQVKQVSIWRQKGKTPGENVTLLQSHCNNR